MAYDERTTMWWLDVGVCGAFPCDTPSHSVNSTKLIKKKSDFEYRRFGVQKTFWEPTFGGL